MNLVQRSNGMWLLEYYEGKKRVRISTGEHSKDKAAIVARAIMSGAHERTQTWTLKDALNDCYSRVWQHQKSAGGGRYLIDKLIRYEGRTLLAAMDYPYLVELRKRMEAPEPEGWGVTPSRANRYMSAISKAFSEAKDLGKLSARPKIPRGLEPKGKLRWLTADEESRLLAACGELWNEGEAAKMRSLLVALLDTGGRVSEVLGVRRTTWQDSDQVAFLDTKNGTSRAVPLTARAREALPGVPAWTNKFACDRFTHLRDHCGFPDVSLHTMRHTCLSRLVQGGMDIYRVMVWAGHSSVVVTQRYAHLAPSSLSAGAEILSRHTSVTLPAEDTNGLRSLRNTPSVPKLSIVK